MKVFDIFKDEDDLADWLDYNTNIVGSGGFSVVYKLPSGYDDYVLKVTEDEVYLLYLKFIEHVNTPHKPIIYDDIVINDCHYILMEKLQMIKDDEIFYLDEQACEAGWQEHDIQPWLALTKTLDEFLNLLDEEVTRRWDDYYSRVYWDLRGLNIMQRVDGTLVVTDPWSVERYN